jgi:hypothetical protein
MTQLAQDALLEVAIGAGASAMAFFVSLIAWDQVWGKETELGSNVRGKGGIKRKWNFYALMNFYSSTTKYSYLPSLMSTPI